MGSGGAEGRRETTPDTKISEKELADEDARRQARDARTCDRLLADLIRFHGGQGRKPHPVLLAPGEEFRNRAARRVCGLRMLETKNSQKCVCARSPGGGDEGRGGGADGNGDEFVHARPSDSARSSAARKKVTGLKGGRSSRSMRGSAAAVAIKTS
jgi:hypothetical protein